ncbi:S41 family peptidase [Patiriisocius hiemis]|uniref:S41 family peptidase n=1 Tax=Patiriisocius hiemis TaxID=3075604 RepID=A0ABU2YAA2_9FLAO|nr:S41 family peptidase [Constantimarinum sp. W242]MDT0554715.1 S41 family peptidase [Constantimarinum sp. W242]
MKKYFFLCITIVSLLFTSCFEDQDDNSVAASTQEIQNFIYRGLNFFYLYKADTPELADDAFANEAELNEFLSNYDSPESLFEYFRSPQDRFSFLESDYVSLENALNGITLNNGMEFGLILYPDNSGNVFGYVRYILPNSSASSTNLQRGDIFNTIDGQQITETNFNDLLSQDTYTIGLADYDGTNVTPTGESVSLTKQQYTENPVYLARTLTIEGQNVGYLMYNGYTRDFDPQLNAAFAQFQADGITNLILDLRYNGGGSVETAVDLSAMITGQFNGQVFYTEEWNAERQDEYADDGLFNTTISNGDPINSLNLNSVYVITSGSTASASELTINSLDPYITVNQIGTATAGKYQASFLLYDAPAPNFSRSQANPNHTYAMLPLVFKTANVNGNTDYDDGLFPDVELAEDYTNLGVLGNENEPLLAAALNEIFPTRNKINRDFRVLKEVSESKASSPVYQVMIGN